MVTFCSSKVAPRVVHNHFVYTPAKRFSKNASSIPISTGSQYRQKIVARRPYLDPGLYSHGALPPMLTSSARCRDMLGIHLVDSIDIQHPGSLANQICQRQISNPCYDKPHLARIPRGYNHAKISAWDSTVRQASAGLWRPPERHLVI